ncbi:hypothetical protein PGTUg99_015987 [Puccinia graminis f. sp. tritici]|uniref:Uncharacterized protein n=1 Tax=Puccinia graminis f. sp. tritici TaxID=56615 RepID=A0A5B0RE09_PUCGR|nr:hypothetical protein PGTUg99_015987 [Puccinia graminis f. sp. tritici]
MDFTPTKSSSTPKSLGRVASGPEPGNSLEHDASVLNRTPARRPSKKVCSSKSYKKVIHKLNAFIPLTG